MMVLPPPHPAGLDDSALKRQTRTVRGRTSGPGGQHRNKVETAIVLTHESTGISAAASERRQQTANLDNALFRLRIALAIQLRTERDLAAGPTELWRSRTTRGGALACNASHRDYPSMLAEALDVLWMKRFDIKKAALLLEVTPSQLVKLVKKEPAALAWLNDQRERHGLHLLK